MSYDLFGPKWYARPIRSSGLEWSILLMIPAVVLILLTGLILSPFLFGAGMVLLCLSGVLAFVARTPGGGGGFDGPDFDFDFGGD
jgi:hypothetical protein